MKRTYRSSLSALPLPNVIDGEKPVDILYPVELSETEMEVFAIEVKGYKFYKFGAVVCPTCGKQQIISRILLPDNTPKWYLEFKCEHYKSPESTNTEIDSSASDAGSDSTVESDPQQPHTQE